MTPHHKELKALVRQWYAFADNNKSQYATAVYWCARQLDELLLAQTKNIKSKKPIAPTFSLILQDVVGKTKNKP